MSDVASRRRQNFANHPIGRALQALGLPQTFPMTFGWNGGNINLGSGDGDLTIFLTKPYEAEVLRVIADAIDRTEDQP